MNLLDLPYEKIFEIMLNNEYDDIMNVCKTNEQLSKICQDSYFWRKKIQRDFPVYEIKDKTFNHLSYKNILDKIINYGAYDKNNIYFFSVLFLNDDVRHQGGSTFAEYVFYRKYNIRIENFIEVEMKTSKLNLIVYDWYTYVFNNENIIHIKMNQVDKDIDMPILIEYSTEVSYDDEFGDIEHYKNKDFENYKINVKFPNQRIYNMIGTVIDELLLDNFYDKFSYLDFSAFSLDQREIYFDDNVPINFEIIENGENNISYVSKLDNRIFIKDDDEPIFSEK